MSDTIGDITRTLGELAAKAKEAGAQAVEAVDKNGTVRAAYANGIGRTKAYAALARLGVRRNGEITELDKIYTEIGKLYYEQARENPEGFFAPLFAQAEATKEKIRALSDEIDALRAEVLGENTDSTVDKRIDEFDNIVSAAEAEVSSSDGE